MKVTIRHVGGEHDGEQEEFPDAPRVGIGPADSHADVRLEDVGAPDSGGREYAEICFDGRCYRIDARQGGPATRVNGQPVESVQLASGDVIEFGEHGPKLEFHYELEVPDEVLHRAGPQVHRRIAHLRRRLTLGLAALGLLVAWILYLTVRTESEAQRRRAAEEESRQSAQQVIRLDRSVEELQRQLQEEQSSRARLLEQSARAQGELEELRARIAAESQSMLDERLAELGRAEREQSEAEMTELRREIAGLRAELGENLPVSRVLQEILQQHDRSVLLLYVEVDYELDTPGGALTRTASGWGSGFLATAAGHVVTCKHVVQPWKFDPETAVLLAEGFLRVDPEAVRISAWSGGSVAFTARGTPDYEQGYNNHVRKNLRRVATAADALQKRNVLLPDGSVRTIEMHAIDNHDLALLQIDGGPFEPLRLKQDTGHPHVRKLDPVMVIGFPQGRGILEATVAETSPSTGTVRKVEDTIYVTASMIPGNSGGPVFAADGEVIGVATRVISETLGICIRAEHVRELLATAAGGP